MYYIYILYPASVVVAIGPLNKTRDIASCIKMSLSLFDVHLLF